MDNSLAKELTLLPRACYSCSAQPLVDQEDRVLCATEKCRLRTLLGRVSREVWELYMRDLAPQGDGYEVKLAGQVTPSV